MPASSEQDRDDVLVCAFAKRPRNAPTVFDVLPVDSCAAAGRLCRWVKKPENSPCCI